MLPNDYVTINQNFSPIPQIYAPKATIVAKNNLWKIPSFPEKLTLCAKFGQKWFCWDFKALPSDYVTINQNFSPIPQMYTPKTTIIAKNNFWKFSQFSRKTYIVRKIRTKMVMLGFEVLPHDYVTINQKISSPIPRIYTLSTTNLVKKNFSKISQ